MPTFEDIIEERFSRDAGSVPSIGTNPSVLYFPGRHRVRVGAKLGAKLGPLVVGRAVVGEDEGAAVVGRGVGLNFGVGHGVGFGVGFGVGRADGVGVGSTVGVGVGRGVG